MSVKSQAPANAGAGRGMKLERDSGMLALDVEDRQASVCEERKHQSVFSLKQLIYFNIYIDRLLAHLYDAHCLLWFHRKW